MYISKLASAAHNNILGGLSGYHINFSISLELLEDAIVSERLLIIKERLAKGLISPNELYSSLNCLEVKCKDIERCDCNSNDKLCGTPTAYVEIPQLISEFGESSIAYLGTSDRQLPFVLYTSPIAFRNHQYRKRGKNKPYVWVDTTPNKNGKCDCFIYNAPLLEQVSITAAFKDLRQLKEYQCCTEEDNTTSLDAEIVDRVSKKMLAYYRQYYMPQVPNNLTYTPG